MLLGGHDKGTELGPLAAAVASRARVAVCFGEAGERMAEALKEAGAAVARADHLCDALKTATSLAHPGDTVLLSPACSSFDEFSSFEERGRAFKEQVADLIAERKRV